MILLCDNCAETELEERCGGDLRAMLYEAGQWEPTFFGDGTCHRCGHLADWAAPDEPLETLRAPQRQDEVSG